MLKKLLTYTQVRINPENISYTEIVEAKKYYFSHQTWKEGYNLLIKMNDNKLFTLFFEFIQDAEKFLDSLFEPENINQVSKENSGLDIEKHLAACFNLAYLSGRLNTSIKASKEEFMTIINPYVQKEKKAV